MPKNAISVIMEGSIMNEQTRRNADEWIGESCVDLRIDWRMSKQVRGYTWISIKKNLCSGE